MSSSRYMATQRALRAVADHMDSLNADIDGLKDVGQEKIERIHGLKVELEETARDLGEANTHLFAARKRISLLEATKYAPPAIEVIDGVAADKSQDADWLRARYFEQSARIVRLEAELNRISMLPQAKTPDGEYSWEATLRRAVEIAREALGY